MPINETVLIKDEKSNELNLFSITVNEYIWNKFCSVRSLSKLIGFYLIELAVCKCLIIEMKALWLLIRVTNYTEITSNACYWF